MKKILFCLTILISQCIFAQQHNIVRCLNMAEQEKMLEAKDPTRKARRDSAERMISRIIANQSMNRIANVETQYTIPVVFHVVWNPAVPNSFITLQQIKRQVKVLNQDYNRLNTDTVNTPVPFRSAATSFHITFCLAEQNNQGWAFSGVIYRKTAVTAFTNNDDVKKPSLGGDTIWNPNRYLNIWVCNLSGGLLGYSEFPTMPLDNTFGSVINYEAIGDSGFLPYAEYNKGRTVTHEVGHLLNLLHPWGDDGGLCPPPGPGTDDGCADTPPEGNNQNDGFGDGSGPTFHCPRFPYTDNCSNTSPGIMFMNFMEYTDDSCMNIFTNNQYTIALATLTGPMDSLVSTSHGCTPGGVTEIMFDNAMNIYPNPSGTGMFNVHIGLTNFSHINVMVYNVLGEIVGTWGSDNVSNTTYDLDLSHQPNGLYFARIYNNEFSVVKKIMISR